MQKRLTIAAMEKLADAGWIDDWTDDELLSNR
jgi:hypothetical protein